MPATQNIDDHLFQNNKSFHYVLRATKENRSFVNIYSSKIQEYKTTRNSDFNIIIYDRNTPTFFYAIPYGYLTQILTTSGLLYGNFWKAIIDNGIFKIKGTRQRLDVTSYFQNFSGIITEDIDSVRNILETLSQVNNIDFSTDSFTEGGEQISVTTRYERDPRLKQQALSIHGCNCAICGFNFENIYGEWGRGFAEIHHVKPLSSSGGQSTTTDPLNEIVIVCSNCHSMIHKKRGTTLTISELQSKIRVRP